MDQHVWERTEILNDKVPEGHKDRLLMKWALSGYSKSALRTGFKLGPFRLDAGHSVFDRWEVLLISHGHADHIFSLASFFLVGSAILDGTQTVFAPDISMIRPIADSVLQCNYNTSKFHVKGIFTDAVPGETHTVEIGQDRYQIQIVKMYHSVPTVGYCVSKWTKRINPSLLPLKEKLSQRDFGTLMKVIKTNSVTKLPSHLVGLVSGHDLPTAETVTLDLCLPQFCFLTDTSIKGISENINTIKEYPIVIVECTFYHKDDLQHAAEKDHIHWVHLESFIRIYQDTLWVLIHASQRYDNRESVLEAINSNGDSSTETEPDIHRNCIIWI